MAIKVHLGKSIDEFMSSMYAVIQGSFWLYLHCRVAVRVQAYASVSSIEKINMSSLCLPNFLSTDTHTKVSLKN